LTHTGTFFRTRDYVHGTVTTPQAVQTGVRILEREEDYYFIQNFQTGFGAHPGSYAVVTGVLYRGIEAAREMTFTTYIHLTPRLRMCGAILIFPRHILMAWTGTSSYYLTCTVPFVLWKLLLRSTVTFTCTLKMKLEISLPKKLPDHTAPRFRQQ
jgi:hypothetical protein